MAEPIASPAKRQERRLYTALIVFTLLFVSLKTIRLPIPYAASLFTLNYDAGVIKRALVGSLLFPGGGPISYATISAVSIAIFLILLSLLAATAARLLRDRPEFFLVLLLFSSSVAIVYLASTVGYFDHILLIFALLAALQSKPALRAFLVAVLGAIAVFIHEAAILMVLPVMYFGLYLALSRNGERPAMLVVGGIAAAHAALTYWVGNHATLSPTEAQALQAGIQARADFQVIALPFRVVSTVPGAEMADTLGRFNPVAHMDSLIIVLPVLVPLLALTMAILHQCRARAFVFVLALAAALSPCVLRFVGVDIHRWDSIALCTSYLALLAVQGDIAGSRPIVLNWRRYNPLLAVLLIVSASTTTFLFKGQEIRGYPFLELRSIVLERL